MPPESRSFLADWKVPEERKKYTVSMADLNRLQRATIGFLGGALLLVHSPASLAGPVDAGAPGATMTRTTIIEGDRSGKVVLELTKPATIDFTRTAAETPAFEIAGSDASAGLLITSADDPGGVNAPMYLGMSFPSESRGQREFAVTNGPGDETFCDTCPLPAGRYAVYLLTQEQVSLTVSIEAAGLSESPTTYQAAPVDADFVIPENTVSEPSEDSVRYWSAYAAGELRGRGTFIHLYFMEGEATPVANIVARGSCWYGASGPAQGVVGPGCPGGSHHFDGLSVDIQGPYSVARMEMTYPLPPSRSGVGAYAGVLGNTGVFGLTAIWLPF